MIRKNAPANTAAATFAPVGAAWLVSSLAMREKYPPSRGRTQARGKAAADGERGAVQTWLAVVVVAAALAAGGCGRGGTLDAAAVRKEAESVRSVAAEGRLLAEDVAEARTYPPFARTHANELGRTAGEEAARLERARTSPSARASAAIVARLARIAGRLLGLLADEVDDREGARRVERALGRIAAEAGRHASP